MKTPEEIKKGLEIAVNGCLTCDCCITDCPYDLECYPMNEDMNVDMPKQMAEDALAYIQQLEERVPKWISVEERLPKRSQKVVVTDGKRTWDYGEFSGLAFCFSSDNPNPRKWNWKKHTVRHVEWWMPKETALPKPPKEG